MPPPPEKKEPPKDEFNINNILDDDEVDIVPKRSNRMIPAKRNEDAQSVASKTNINDDAWSRGGSRWGTKK